MYACKIEKTTNGSWRGACGQTRQALQIIAKGGLAKHVQIDEQSGAAQNGQEQAQESTEEKTTVTISQRSAQARGAHSFCIIAVTSFNGSVLTLLVPVKGWSST